MIEVLPGDNLVDTPGEMIAYELWTNGQGPTVDYMQGDHVQNQFRTFNYAATVSPHEFVIDAVVGYDSNRFGAVNGAISNGYTPFAENSSVRRVNENIALGRIIRKIKVK